MEIVHSPIDSLKVYERNARQHSDKQIGKIAASIQAFGFNNPILVNKADIIVAGHGRWAAAKTLGLSKVPTVCLDHLTEDEIKAYIIADNKLAELASFQIYFGLVLI